MEASSVCASDNGVGAVQPVRTNPHKRANQRSCPSRIRLEAESDDHSDVPSFMTFQLQPVVPARIAIEICSEHLRHHSQSCPPFFLPVSGYRAGIKCSAFPNSVLRQFIMIANLQTQIPM